MRQTLKQRIIPEVDNRQLDRESGKVSSYVEKALKDISPMDPDSIFDMGDMMDHVSGMQEQSEDMFDDTFMPSGDFASDIAFSQEPSIAGGGTSNDEGGAGAAMEIADSLVEICLVRWVISVSKLADLEKFSQEVLR